MNTEILTWAVDYVQNNGGTIRIAGLATIKKTYPYVTVELD